MSFNIYDWKWQGILSRELKTYFTYISNTYNVRQLSRPALNCPIYTVHGTNLEQCIVEQPRETGLELQCYQQSEKRLKILPILNIRPANTLILFTKQSMLHFISK